MTRFADTPLAGLGSAISGFAIDHREVAPGHVFGAFRGAAFDAETVIPEAIARGAIAVIARPEAKVEGALHVPDPEPRRLFAALAGRYFAPFPELVVAVTGTNGKTSTVELARQLWRLAGHRAASIGTLGVTTDADRAKAGRGGLTSPDIVTFLATAAGLAREGISHLAFEASSHGLDQRRVAGIPLAAAAFTNFTRDHLDYHGTMEAYFAAKAQLFGEMLSRGGAAVVWQDHASESAHWNARICGLARSRGQRLLTVGPDGDALRLVARVPTLLGQTLEVAHGAIRQKVTLPLIGAYQAANAMVAAGLVIATGGEPGKTLADLARVTGVRGRLERAVITRAGAPVYVDYAHTPDALAAAIAALRPHAANRLITVFGCGGDRDRGKRPEMGRIAAEQSDVALVTDDNPRTEDPGAIRAEILAGSRILKDVPGRRAAIARAIALARDGDIVLIAGKGHEQGQTIGDHVHPFDDVEVARDVAAGEEAA
ncbi:MAG: UDP-N-acetylmuramoyl-L-alanyl-D-glutamate--2,6-diaminopimelate ligase [Thermaurantiacus sp.]